MRWAGLACCCVLLVAAAVYAGPVSACSMMRGYRVPTNLELVAAADTIVIGVAESGAKLREDGPPSLVVQPATLLKGAALPGLIEVPDAVVIDGTKPSRWIVASDPRELRAPNPAALMGSCVRYAFAKDMKLVLFLKRDSNGALVPYRSAFSRDAEDVADENSLWVKAVREYVPISLAPRSEWKNRLRARIAELRASPADPDALAIAADMAVELSGKRLPPED